MLRTKSSIWSRDSCGGFTTTSTPSPRTLSSKSVTSAATSISASARRSRPVISQSIHTSRSFTTRRLLGGLSLLSDPPPSLEDMQWIGVIARLVVGGVWLTAGVLKLPDPTESVRAVRNYQLLPEALVPLVGHLLPLVEIVVGVCLVVGILVRANAVVSVVLLGAFIVGIASAWARGLSIECGCFGGGGTVQDPTAAYPWEIARDVGLLLAAAWLVRRPRGPWALDNTLFGPQRDLEEVT